MHYQYYTREIKYNDCFRNVMLWPCYDLHRQGKGYRHKSGKGLKSQKVIATKAGFL